MYKYMLFYYSVILNLRFFFFVIDGYGKSIYFWSLVSALGTFWFGAGITFWHSVRDLVSPALALHSCGPEVWGVLGISFAIDGYVLSQVC